ncbi:hypothetical protein [Cohnella sp.]|uniref:hypothetical protein n=1 Tax=Cohnella sp. TaxID=1883426 RepID=UPI0035664320
MTDRKPGQEGEKSFFGKYNVPALIGLMDRSVRRPDPIGTTRRYSDEIGRFQNLTELYDVICGQIPVFQGA